VEAGALTPPSGLGLDVERLDPEARAAVERVDPRHDRERDAQDRE
jgi:hypothetical protein